jgi:hypothetical protein
MTKLEKIAKKYNILDNYEITLDVINFYLDIDEIDNASELAINITSELNENRANNELYVTYYTNDNDEPTITITNIFNNNVFDFA